VKSLSRTVTNFRGFDDDLFNAERWNKDKDAILCEIGAPILLAPIQETLADLQKKLEAKFKSVNQHINNGDNKYIKTSGSTSDRRKKSAALRSRF
jgi:hypothetical protein